MDSVNIGGTEYALGYNLRVRMIYEKIMGKPVGESMMTFENVVFFYSVLLAFNKGFAYDLESFADALVEDEGIYARLVEWIYDYNRRRADIDGPADGGGDTGDKKKR